MEWKKHSKKISDLQKANTEIDMKVRNRLDSMIEEMLNQDVAVPLHFLIEHLHLDKDRDDAMQELRLHVGLLEGIEYGVIVDDNDQSVFVFFKKTE
ncbi:MAG: hypothetical protein E4H14_07265 [Candidatus Thorarchaeota archaeon]|nr:MAG: hypothetical protein E4H14_07265 [Candidatus Thorarchaeota archaeon]